MKIGTGFQAILKFRFRNLRSCNVSLADRERFMKGYIRRDYNYKYLGQTLYNDASSAVETGSGVMIYVPSFIKICSRIKKLIGV
jgi:hypothetical protein